MKFCFPSSIFFCFFLYMFICKKIQIFITIIFSSLNVARMFWSRSITSSAKKTANKAITLVTYRIYVRKPVDLVNSSQYKRNVTDAAASVTSWWSMSVVWYGWSYWFYGILVQFGDFFIIILHPDPDLFFREGHI